MLLNCSKQNRVLIHLFFAFCSKKKKQQQTNQVVLADQTTQVVDANQMPQIIYQQNAQPAQIHADGQIHYVVQEEEHQNDSYSLVSQPGTPQVYYSKIQTENGTQLIPHTGEYRICLGFIFRLSFLF